MKAEYEFPEGKESEGIKIQHVDRHRGKRAWHLKGRNKAGCGGCVRLERRSCLGGMTDGTAELSLTIRMLITVLRNTDLIAEMGRQ